MMPLLTTLLLLAAEPPPAVMVLYFDNDTGDAAMDPLGKGLADMMITDLSKVPGIRVVERDKLQALLGELKLQRSKYFDPKTAQKLGKGVGAKFAISGSFAAVDPQLRINVRVIKIASGTVVKAASVTGDKSKFFALQTQLAKELSRGLQKALAKKNVQLQPSPGAQTLTSVAGYGQSLDYRDAGDPKKASEKLQEVVNDNPDFALARARYMEIMKEVYAAKTVRNDALAQVEDALFASTEARVQRVLSLTEFKMHWRMDLVAAVVQEDIHLRRLAAALNGPASGYLPHAQAYMRLAERRLAVVLQDPKPGEKRQGGGFGNCSTEWHCMSFTQREQMQKLGLVEGGETPERNAPHQIMQDMADFMMHGMPPFKTTVQLPKAVCYYKADPAYPQRAFQLLDRADQALEDYSPGDTADELEAEHVGLAISRAGIQLRLGKPELALSALQQALTKYPHVSTFASVEGYIKTILDGKMPKELYWKCADPN
jgi:TolB-like protein